MSVVGAVDLVEVDPVGVEPAQRVLDRAHDPAARVAAPVGILAHGVVELRGEDDVVAAAAGERLADDLLGLARPVDVGCVDEVDPGVERMVDDPDGLVVVGVAPGAEHHRAEAELADRNTSASEWSKFHKCSSQLSIAGAALSLDEASPFRELRKAEVRRILLPRTRVNKALLVCPLALRGPIGTQPQRDMFRLHRVPYHTHQVVAKGIQIRLVPELGREGFQSLSGIVLTAVEATIYERLYATLQRAEQRGYSQGGGDHRQG